MSKSVNKVTLLGFVGKDPEIKTAAAGMIIANFSIATSDRQKDSNGEWQDKTEWHNLVAFKKTAEIIRDYVTKGSKVYIEGKLSTSSWADKQSGQKRYKTEIIVNEIVLLSSNEEKRTQKVADNDFDQSTNSKYSPQTTVTDDPDSIPF
jgi:single-strand DNA-binding protein